MVAEFEGTALKKQSLFQEGLFYDFGIWSYKKIEFWGLSGSFPASLKVKYVENSAKNGGLSYQVSEEHLKSL